MIINPVALTSRGLGMEKGSAQTILVPLSKKKAKKKVHNDTLPRENAPQREKSGL